MDTPLDLTKNFPRSPRATLGGYVIAARTLDKCRADVAGTLGEYHFNCPLDQIFFEFSGIEAGPFRDFVATGATDDEVAEWIGKNATSRERPEIIQWNNGLRDRRISELPADLQVFLEDYIPENLPGGTIIHVWFDVYDIEEGRLKPR